MAVICIENLVKQYGRFKALKGATLSIEQGEIFGLLGQNGAGKTTLVKILLGITRATSGEARLLGEPAGMVDVRRRVGYLPEDHRFPDYHTAFSLLDFYGALLGVRRKERMRCIPRILESVGLKARMYAKIRSYSKGMKQRLGIAQAIFHDPAVIFLDEPTDGVDPVGRREVRALLLELKKAGKTIFLNSHLLGEVELICNRVAILQDGEVLREGDIASLTRQRGLFVLEIAPEQELPWDDMEKRGYQVKKKGHLWEVKTGDDPSMDSLVDLLRDRGVSVRHLVEKQQSLEDVFIETVIPAKPGGDVPLRAQEFKAARQLA